MTGGWRRIRRGNLVVLLLAPESFAADHGPCFKDATIGYGVGSEKAYKACVLQKAWTRIQGTASAPPTEPHFRGPEDDEDFKAASPEELMAATTP